MLTDGRITCFNNVCRPTGSRRLFSKPFFQSHFQVLYRKKTVNVNVIVWIMPRVHAGFQGLPEIFRECPPNHADMLVHIRMVSRMEMLVHIRNISAWLGGHSRKIS